jgi:hypothetical protein
MELERTHGMGHMIFGQKSVRIYRIVSEAFPIREIFQRAESSLSDILGRNPIAIGM